MLYVRQCARHSGLKNYGAVFARKGRQVNATDEKQIKLRCSVCCPSLQNVCLRVVCLFVCLLSPEMFGVAVDVYS